MIKLCDSKKCCGCSACSSVCTRGAITMLPDSEGFLSPVVDDFACVDCGLCAKVCPVLNKPSIDHGTERHLYAIQNKDEKVRCDSPSGGFFSILATHFILQYGGFVCGAIYDEHFVIKHLLTNNIEEICLFSGSKYVQSDVSGLFPQISKLLKENQWVLFSGTPCQVNGLLSYLRKPYSNLVTVELVCHGVPSPKYWSAYLEYQQNLFGSRIIKANFRHKKYGFKSGSLMLQFENGRQYFGSHDSDFMLRPFSQNESLRWSCYDCSFKGVNRASDFTIYDGWHIGIWNRAMNDDKGTTLVLCNNEKAKVLFDKIYDQMKVQEVAVDDPWAIKDAVMMFKQPSIGTNRNRIYQLLNSEGFDKMSKSILPVSIKLRLKILAKKIMGMLGLMSIIGKLKSLR